MGLKFFKRGTYGSVSNALSLIRQEFEALWNKIDNLRISEDSSNVEPQSYIPQLDQGGGSAEYNGFFKITYSKNRIKIANALTCFVNNTKTSVHGGFDFDSTSSGDEYDYQMGVSDDWLKSKHAICLKFLASSTSSSTGLWVIDGTELPDNSDSEVWYMLGIIDVGGTVQQIHTSGYPRLLWLYRCTNE